MKYKIYAIHMNSYITTYICCIKEHWYSSWKSVNVINDLQLTTDSFKWKEYRNVEDAINAVKHILAVNESRSKWPVLKVFDKGVWPPKLRDIQHRVVTEIPINKD